MKITFIRHFEVDFQWDKFYGSSAFDNACKQYDQAPVLNNLNVKSSGNTFYVSTLSRTADTLRLITNPRNAVSLDLLNEIPLVSFTDTTIRLPTFIWMTVGRLQWYFNHRRQPEVRKISRRRVCQFLDQIQAAGQDCTIVGHGLFFVQLSRELQRRGATGNMKKRLKYGETRVYIL